MCNKTGIPVYTLDNINAHNYGFILLSMEFDFDQISRFTHIHRPDYYCLLYLKSGQLTASVDKETFILERESVVCINPNSVCNFSIEDHSKGWIVLFSDTFYSMRYNDNVLHHFGCLKNKGICIQKLSQSEAQKWSFLLSTMESESSQWQFDSKNILRSYLNIVLSELNRKTPEINSIPPLDDKEQKILSFEKIVEQKFKEEKLPSFYAACLNISVNYLNKICNDRRSLSSGDIIRKRVTLEAERLLYYTTKTISEISYDLGFDSISYFTTFFKKKTGLTPESFRKKMKTSLSI